MFYKPNYCNNCGEKIDRYDWNFFTSTRFCETCESDFKFQERLPLGIIGIGILGIVFGVGSWMKTPEKNVQIATNQLPISSTIETKEASKKETVNLPLEAKENVAKVESKAFVSTEVKQTKPAPLKQETVAIENPNSSKTLQTKTSQVVQNEPVEVVYYCGAKTKKGTPCSRKVKGATRCWQHFGQPAILPQEKLKAIE
jgi:hypothetical protein